MKHCNIPALGDFDYDETFFRPELIENDLYDEWDNMYCLRYIGMETDLSQLKLPEGLKNARYMFEGSLIKIPPIIPYGIEDCESMFAHSMIERGTNLPSSVRNARSMYEDTPITKAPAISGALTNGERMFADCKNLSRMAPYVGSGKRKTFEEMYDGCPLLTGQKREPQNEMERFVQEEELPFF